jgi:drug/metabolite transporter (DMT)-like permease
MPFYVFAFIGALTSGISVIIMKLTSKHSVSNPWILFILLSYVSLLFTAPLALFNNAGIPVDWTPLILAAITSTAFNVLWIISTYALDVSVFAPLFNFKSVFAILIGAMFLHEQLSGTQLIFVGIILVAGVFTSVDENLKLKSFFTKKIGIALLSTLVLAIYNAFIKLSQAHNSLWTTNLWVAIFGAVFALPLLFTKAKEIREIKFKHVAPVLLFGAFSVITDFAANSAYAVNIGMSSLIMSIPFSMLIALVLAFVAPKVLEKHTVKIYIIRVVSALVMLVCSLMLTRG